MSTYVLVHGGWAGGWAWRETARVLRDAGHEVYSPSLTGLGERVHLARPDIDMNTHIEDISNVLIYENLTEVVLVGASYSGMVITGVAERHAARLRRVVYVDAFVPRDGESLADLLGDQVMGWFREAAGTKGDGWRIPLDAPDADRTTDLPLRPLETPVAVRSTAAAALPHTFIYCTLKEENWLAAVTREAGRRAKSAGWEYRELATDHSPSLSNPRELAAVLLQLS